MPQPSDFQLTMTELPPLRDGEFLLRNAFLSMDAGLRGLLDETPGYYEGAQLGAPVRGMAISEVVATRDAAFPVGTIVRSFATWAELSIVHAGALGLEIVTPDARLRLQDYMGGLGPVGVTAWIGLHVIGRMQASDTVLVSAAAGATGWVAVQLAQAAGCRVVALAGTAVKIARLRALGVAAAIDHRAEPDLPAAIAAAAPAGVDVFFDSVGGALLETVLPLMADRGRVVACGMISDYNRDGAPYGVKTLWNIVTRRLTVQGFLTFDHADRLAEAGAALERMALDGRLRMLETIYEGLGSAPAAFIDLMHGRTSGKPLVRVQPASSIRQL